MNFISIRANLPHFQNDRLQVQGFLKKLSLNSCVANSSLTSHDMLSSEECDNYQLPVFLWRRKG